MVILAVLVPMLFSIQLGEMENTQKLEPRTKKQECTEEDLDHLPSKYWSEKRIEKEETVPVLPVLKRIMNNPVCPVCAGKRYPVKGYFDYNEGKQIIKCTRCWAEFLKKKEWVHQQRIIEEAMEEQRQEAAEDYEQTTEWWNGLTEEEKKEWEIKWNKEAGITVTDKDLEGTR